MTKRRDADDWGAGASILAAATLAELRAAIDETPLIVEHRFYRGSRAPERRIIDDADELLAYLHSETRAGDAIWIWRYDRLCRNSNALAHGKVPDVDGLVPRGGAY